MPSGIRVDKPLSRLLLNAFSGLINLACLVVGVGFLVYTAFMTPDYPGHAHNMQIIGMLLLVLGSIK